MSPTQVRFEKPLKTRNNRSLEEDKLQDGQGQDVATIDKTWLGFYVGQDAFTFCSEMYNHWKCHVLTSTAGDTHVFFVSVESLYFLNKGIHSARANKTYTKWKFKFTGADIQEEGETSGASTGLRKGKPTKKILGKIVRVLERKYINSHNIFL